MISVSTSEVEDFKEEILTGMSITAHPWFPVRSSHTASMSDISWLLDDFAHVLHTETVIESEVDR